MCGLVWVVISNAKAEPDARVHQWPQWRGPLATGVAPHGDPPTEWDEKKNVKWKIALPGLGHSSPVVWGDRVYVTSAVPVGDGQSPRYSGRPGAHNNLPITHRQQFVVMCVDRKTGKKLWQTKVHEAIPHEGGHETGSLASASPVTDGKHVYAFFGSYGLYCLDTDGKVVWQAQLGKMHTKHGHGEGASPVLHGDTLVVNWDHEGDSSVAAFDARTGKRRWQVERDEVTSWATPIVVEDAGRAQVIISGTKRVRGYDLATGTVVWECGGLSHNVVASPVAADGVVYVGSSYETRAMMAIRFAGAKGDITDTDRVLWRRRRGTPYVPSPLLVDGAIYFLAHYQAIMSRVEAATGEDDPGPMRLPGLRNIYASPVSAAGRVYVTSIEGATIVLGGGAEPKSLTLNRLDDRFSASAAIVGNELFLRGHRFLYCLSNDTSPTP